MRLAAEGYKVSQSLVGDWARTEVVQADQHVVSRYDTVYKIPAPLITLASLLGAEEGAYRSDDAGHGRRGIKWSSRITEELLRKRNNVLAALWNPRTTQMSSMAQRAAS